MTILRRLKRLKRKLQTNRSVPPSPTREEPAEITQDTGTKPRPCRDPAHHNPTQEDRRRPFYGQVGALLRRLFLRGRKEKERVSGDPEEINVIPTETTNHEDDVPAPERETQPTSSSDGTRVLSEESEFTPSVETAASPIDGMHAGIPSETVSIPESGIETTTTTTDNVSDSEDTIPTNHAADLEERLLTILESAGVQKDGVEIIIPPKIAPVGGRPKYSYTIVLTSKTEATTVPEGSGASEEDTNSTTTDGRESTRSSVSVYYSAEEEFTPSVDSMDALIDGPEISIPTETEAIPESRIEIADTPENVSDSEDTIQTNHAADLEERLLTILESVGVQKDEVEIIIPPNIAPVGRRPKYSYTIVLTSKTTTITTDNVSDSEDTIQTNHAADLEERLLTILESVGVQKDEVEIIIPPNIAPVGKRPKYSYTIVFTSKTETTGRSDEAMPTAEDGIESTIGETAAGLEDWKKISIPTETASIPKSLIGIYEPISEMKTEVTKRTDYVPGSAGLPLTTQEEPTEDKPRPRGESGQPAQKTSTCTGKCRSFFRKIGALFCKKKREEEEEEDDNAKEITDIQSDVPTILTVESFKYHKLLGKGAFGKVYLASHPDVEELLAVKKARRRSKIPFSTFMAERRAQEMLGCSGVCPQLYATFHSEDYFFYVMEYVDGENLGHFIPMRYPVDNDIIRYVAAELLCAIQFLHSRGISHNDLHLCNVLINSTGHVKIIDFGTAIITALPFWPETVATMPDICLKTIWKEYRNDYFDYYCILRAMSQYSKADPNSAFYHHLHDLIEEWKTMYGNMRQHQLFEGIDWKELESGKGRPPYVMEPKPAINRSKTIKVRAIKRRLMECRRSPLPPDFPEFDFVSSRWRMMLQTSHRLRPSAPPEPAVFSTAGPMCPAPAQPGPCAQIQHSQAYVLSSCTARPLCPAPAQLGPCDPAPAQPGPCNPAQPGPCDPAPALPGPCDPASALPGPCDPAPALPGPCDPALVQPGPCDPAQPGPCDPAQPGPCDPAQPSPCDPAPAQPGPCDPAPCTVSRDC